MNFLFGPVGKMARNATFPYALQVLMLLVFAYLVITGWGVGNDVSDMSYLKILRKTNSSTLLIWGIWWPLMIIGVVALGRVWCTVCPMELVNNLTHRVSSRLGLSRVSLPAWLRAGYLIFLLYLALQLLVGGISLHRVPGFTSYMLIAILALAAISGVVFKEPRSFCKGFCPANLLLSVYGRFSPVQLDTLAPGVCRSCRSRDCMRADALKKWNGQSCASRVPAFDREQGDACVLCFQCVKACPHDNVGFGITTGQSPARRRPVLTVAESLFVILASGFITHEVFTEIKPMEWIFHWPVERFYSWAGVAISWDWVHTFWYLFLFPFALWFLILGIIRLFEHRNSFWELLTMAATSAAPIIATAHVAKALAKLNSWAGFLPMSLAQPGGIPNADSIFNKTLAAPGLVVPYQLVGIIVIVLILLGSIFALRELRKIPNGTLIPSRISVLVIGLMYTAVFAFWPFIH